MLLGPAAPAADSGSDSGPEPASRSIEKGAWRAGELGGEEVEDDEGEGFGWREGETC